MTNSRGPIPKPAEGFGKSGLARPGLIALPKLCDQLERAHHSVLLNQLDRVDRLARKVIEQPRTADARAAKIRSAIAALRHTMSSEEKSIFPLIRAWERKLSGSATAAGGSLRPAIARMQREHEHAEESLDELRALTAADAASPAMRRLHDAVGRLENSLHRQIYLENQILFRRSLGIRISVLARTFADAASSG